MITIEAIANTASKEDSIKELAVDLLTLLGRPSRRDSDMFHPRLDGLNAVVPSNVPPKGELAILVGSSHA
jgi:hypothetical protein